MPILFCLVQCKQRDGNLYIVVVTFCLYNRISSYSYASTKIGFLGSQSGGV